MGCSYADRTCRKCGKRIVLYRPQNDAGKPEQSRTGITLDYMEFQREHAVLCRPCSRKIARREIHRYRKLGKFDGIDTQDDYLGNTSG